MSHALQDKVAVITGAGRGLGKVFALRFAEEGAKLLLPDISAERAEQTAEQIRAAGGDAVAMWCDISQEGAAQAVAEKVISLHGRVDILVNNAGLVYGIEPRPWTDWPVELWDRFFTTNVRGSWLMCKAIAPLMERRGQGKIVNIASDIFKMPAAPGLLPYACSKAALHEITQALARALGPAGIHVNSLAPGLTGTESVLTLPGNEQMFTATIGAQCIKQREEPEDLAAAAVFLASESSDFVTGQLLVVDGGAAFAV